MSEATNAKIERVLELLLLFFVLPTLVLVGRVKLPALPMLWVVTAYCVIVLWQGGNLGVATVTFNPDWHYLPQILLLFSAFAVIVTFCVRRFAPQDLFNFVLNRPVFWAIVMVAYPILSVYPQGIIFRAFFFQRYQSLLPNPWMMVAVSGIAFAYMHVVFRNWVAVGLTALGGFLFAARYHQTHSLFLSCLEHALYGCWLFTVGLGRSFLYRGNNIPVLNQEHMFGTERVLR